MPINELKARLDIKELPGEERGLYNTLAGLILAQLGHLPHIHESMTCEEWVFTVTDMEGRRIDKVKAHRAH